MTVLDFLKTMYGEVASGYLTVWTMPDKRTVYFPIAEPEAAAAYAESRFDTHDVYYGVGLRRQKLGENQRGSNTDVSAIPAFWADIDIKGDAHKETALPENADEAMAFLESLPLAPSIIVSSGNGLHVYWLFDNPLGIATESHRANIAAALSGWQGLIITAARERGWKIDNTSDLARVLRLPGGLNHKRGNDVRCTVISETDTRYAPSDFTPYIVREEKTAAPPMANRPATADASKFDGKVGASDVIIEKCAFVRYCRDNAVTLPEPYWHVMVSNIALCSDGAARVHEFSRPYPDYTAAETDKKIANAYKEQKPHTCAYIQQSLGFDCGECGAGCKAPVALAVITRADEVREMLEGEISEWQKVFDDDFIAALSYAKAKMPADYGKFKMRIKGKVNILDLEKCVKAHDLAQRKHAAALGEPLELDGIDLGGAVVPRKWQVSIAGGVRRVQSSKDGEVEIVACPDPVVIKRRLVNIDDDTEQIELCFFKDNRWKSVIGRRTQLNNKNSVLSFGDAGLQVTSNTSAEFISYLSDYEAANKESIQYVPSTSRLGWLGDAYRSSQFFPYSTDGEVVFEEDKGTTALYKNLTERGSYDEWLAMMRRLRGNPIARFMTAVSFASPLLCKIGVRTFVVHLWHMSASGKSAALKAALSVWGNPLRIMGGGFATIVGLEQLAGTLRYLPFGIDEKQSADERRLPMEMLLYILGQGYGKTRGAKGGGNAEVIDWHNIVMLTGEEPVTKNSSLDGVQTRTFELYGKPIDDIEFAKDVHVVSENNFGFAGAIYIRALCEKLRSDSDYLRRLYKTINAELRSRGLRNLHADYVAAVAVGDYLAEQIIFGSNADDAMTSALRCAEAVFKTNENEMGSDSIERAWDFITGWLVGNTQRFDPDSSPCFGRCSKSQGEKLDEYFVIPQFLDAALEDAGFNVRKTMSGLRERGLIETYTEPHTGKVRTKIRKRIDGKPIAGYLFMLKNEDAVMPLSGKGENTGNNATA